MQCTLCAKIRFWINLSRIDTCVDSRFRWNDSKEYGNDNNDLENDNKSQEHNNLEYGLTA